MEVIRISSGHDLSAKARETRPVGPHSYMLHCRQFMLVERDWEKQTTEPRPMMSVMTVGAGQIWMTEEETHQVQEAIKAMRSPITLD